MLVMDTTVSISDRWSDTNIAHGDEVDSFETMAISPCFVSVKRELNVINNGSSETDPIAQRDMDNSVLNHGRCRNDQLSTDAHKAIVCPESTVNLCDSIQNTCPSLGKLKPRCQVDIIDMRNEQVLDYKFIFAYEDQRSKFVILRPLKTKDPKEVATELLDVFTIIGVPRVVQSGNGRMFARHIVHELRALWVDLMIVHGEVVSLSSATKRDFLKLVKSWLTENPSKLWCEALKFVQLIENTTFVCESKKTPHELLFKTINPFDMWTASDKSVAKIWTEEDWVKLTATNETEHSENIAFSSQCKLERIINQDGTGDKSSTVITDVNTTTKSPNEAERDAQEACLKRSLGSRQASSGFKFVSVKSESSLEIDHSDESQSDGEEYTTNRLKRRQYKENELQCKICKKSYKKLGHLKNHIKSHSKTDGLECTICCKKFRFPTVYEKHMRRFHDLDENSKDDTNASLNETRNNVQDEISQSKRLVDERRRSEVKHVQDGKQSTNKSEKRSHQSGNKKLPKELRSTKLNGTRLLECSYCQQKFDFPSVLKRHVRSHTNERPYVCQVCNKSFKQLGHLSQHSLTHTDYRSFQCAACGVKFESLDSLKVHSQTHKGDSAVYRPKEIYRLFECDNCKKVFTTKSVLERHIFTHTHERQFGCKVCGKRFKQAGHVKSHMLVHTGERKFECKICSKRFSLSNSLKKHMYVHNGEKPYQCDVCGARFLEKRNLNGHLMTHTNERPFSCNICGKRYTLADTLRRHISAAHEDGRTYQCEICAKMFKQLAHLYVHKKVHTDERPYQCHLCEKNFKHKNVLKSHLAIHANLRPFECDVCKATFVRKTNLQTHIASAHMNERPYVCTICNKRFKQVSHLNGHVVVHSNSMPYQCDFCDRRCNRLDNLKKHMRLHTKTKEQNSITT